VLPQSMPTGCERTTPPPASVTLSVRCTAGAAAKTALTLRAWLIVTVQLGPAPVQAPPQPLSTWPAPGVALSTTLALAAKGALQVLPQSMPAGCERTVPLPVTVTPSVKLEDGGALKLAVTVRAACIVSVQLAAVPVQSPPQPPKTWPLAGVALSVTEVAGSKRLLQLAPQSMPAGAETTRPLPLTETESALPVGKGLALPPPPPPQAARQTAVSRANNPDEQLKRRVRSSGMGIEV